MILGVDLFKKHNFHALNILTFSVFTMSMRPLLWSVRLLKGSIDFDCLNFDGALTFAKPGFYIHYRINQC